LRAQLRAVFQLGLQSNHGSGIAAHTVAHHGQWLVVQTQLLAVCIGVLRRGVVLVDRRRVMRFGRRRVVDEDRLLARVDHEVPNKAFMGREVAQNPAAAMEEHEARQCTLGTLRTHDGQLQRLAVPVDGLLGHLGRRQLGTLLCTDQHLTRVGG